MVNIAASYATCVHPKVPREGIMDWKANNPVCSSAFWRQSERLETASRRNYEPGLLMQ